MEKFSAYRDAGTGIQPFLTPVPPAGSELLAQITLPIRYALAAIRTTLVLAVFLVYLLLVRGICLVFLPIPSIYDAIVHLFTFVLGRAILFILGLFWIPVEQTSRKRRNNNIGSVPWNPKAGDLIISNWVSWIEIIWLAIRFNPIFVLPLPEKSVALPTSTQASPIAYTPGRRTGTGSANIQQPARSASQRRPIAGFKQVSLLQMINSTGYAPPFVAASDHPQTLEAIRKGARRPIVVFPECTTSNGRSLLRFANVFNRTVPVKGFNVFVMCVRYDPPTIMSPTPSQSIPSSFMNPLPHVIALTTSLSPLSISIRLLAPSESPSSQLFMANEFVAGAADEDQLSESSAALIAQIGKFKRTGMGWEDKANLLEIYGVTKRR